MASRKILPDIPHKIIVFQEENPKFPPSFKSKEPGGRNILNHGLLVIISSHKRTLRLGLLQFWSEFRWMGGLSGDTSVWSCWQECKNSLLPDDSTVWITFIFLSFSIITVLAPIFFSL